MRSGSTREIISINKFFPVKLAVKDFQLKF